jgi:predicted TIM-barrel fold metal-dependent hydrolase
LGGLGALFACSSSPALAPHFPRAPACEAGCLRADAHCHVFNGSDLPIEGFLSQIAMLPQQVTRPLTSRLHRAVDALAPSGRDELAKLAELERAGTRVEAPSDPTLPAELATLKDELVQALRPALPNIDFEALVARVTRVLATVVRPRHLVAAELIGRFESLELFVPLMVDYDYWTEGSPETHLTDQLLVQSRLSALSLRGLLVRERARLHPFAPFNPLREVREALEPLKAGVAYRPFGPSIEPGKPYDCTLPLPPLDANGSLPGGKGALVLLRHAIERLGFAGVKVYPPVGFLPLDNAGRGALLHGAGQSGLGASLDLCLRAFYSYCEAQQVPVMTHAADSSGYQPGYGQLADPSGWEAVLQEFPNLRLCLGHFGHLDGLGEDDTLAACSAWMRRCAVLMQRYPNVYADMSSSPLAFRAGSRERYMALLGDVFARFPRTRLRVAYGSDFWLSKLQPNYEFVVDAFYEALSGAFDAATVADLMGTNTLRYLGIVGDDGQAASSNANRRRLLAFYAAEGVTPLEWMKA